MLKNLKIAWTISFLRDFLTEDPLKKNIPDSMRKSCSDFKMSPLLILSWLFPKLGKTSKKKQDTDD